MTPTAKIKTLKIGATYSEVVQVFHTDELPPKVRSHATTSGVMKFWNWPDANIAFCDDRLYSWMINNDTI